MIELMYFDPGQAHKGYQVIQFRAGEPWRIVDDGELLCSLEKREGKWHGRNRTTLAGEVIEGIGSLIDQQHFNRLPLEIKAHWNTEVAEAIAQGGNQYLVICKPDVDFQGFEKVFSTYISTMVKDQREIRFRVYDADMSEDFEVFAKQNA